MARTISINGDASGQPASAPLGKTAKKVAPPRRKYNNVPTVVDGITFHSKKEGRRYSALKLLAKGKQIKALKLQPKYVFAHNGVHIGKYTADFSYVDVASGAVVVEDVKGGKATKTADYVLRKNLMLALHGIVVVEV